MRDTMAFGYLEPKLIASTVVTIDEFLRHHSTHQPASGIGNDVHTNSEVRPSSLAVVDGLASAGSHVESARQQPTTDAPPNRGAEEGERCPKATARTKQEPAVTLAGVAFASSCQIILPVFGALFGIVGLVLTIASYRGQEDDELPEQYADRISLTSNLRILGPVCLAVGLLMAAAGLALCYIARRNKQNNLTFRCPIHGDFYPISASHSHLIHPRKRSSFGGIWGKDDSGDLMPTPQCPHSTRSSVSTGPPAQLSPLPPVISSSGYLTAGNLMQMGDSGGSTQSLAMSYDVASFPHSRSSSPCPENEPTPDARASTAT